MPDYGHCPQSPDEIHCDHWWDGDTCGFCNAPPLDNEARAEQGMEPYSAERDPHGPGGTVAHA